MRTALLPIVRVLVATTRCQSQGGMYTYPSPGYTYPPRVYLPCGYAYSPWIPQLLGIPTPKYTSSPQVYLPPKYLPPQDTYPQKRPGTRDIYPQKEPGTRDTYPLEGTWYQRYLPLKGTWYQRYLPPRRSLVPEIPTLPSSTD